ncbi:hypothetical protein SASPL_139069 [Salvia splendens]|uniref:holo-[acyl-carrier-protein] synthase n=1 Tax=Salvia splendens TaxID=180675 RepID=A0A8X8ZFM7_SALSN|nr:hypothetical protein SASPL_139069 [Salvia splendens]
MELEKGVQRWIVDISIWNPSPHHFNLVISLLPHHEHTSITRFVKFEDRKRALVSRLLQYALVHQVLGIPFDDITIKRTPEGKPFLVHTYILNLVPFLHCIYASSFVEFGTLASTLMTSYLNEVCHNNESGFPNFNFNVSHHGDYVAIASEPVCLVGVDIVTHSVPVNEPADEFVHSFSSYWCLKEAFVKAIGSGVGHKLDDVEFHHTSWENISVKVCGKELKDWRFWLLNLSNNHSVAIARGHPRSAISSYMITLNQIDFKEEYKTCLNLPNPSFSFLTVDDLVRSWGDDVSEKT